MNQKGFVSAPIVIGLVLLAGTIGYFGFTWKKCDQVSPPKIGEFDLTIIEKDGHPYQCRSLADRIFPPKITFPAPPSTSTTTQEQPAETADWKTYRDTTYGFEIKYPLNWNLKNNVLSFSTKNGYVATFGVEGISPTTRDFTIDEMRKEYDRTSGNNPRAPKAAEVLKNIFIGSEAGLEWAVITCEQGNPCYARYEFYGNSTWRKGFKFYLVVPNLKSGDVNSSYDPRSLFLDDITTVRKVLSTFKFVN